MRYFGLGGHRQPGKHAEAKHCECVYRPGRCDYWVKVKSREHHGPTYEELKISFSSSSLLKNPLATEGA